MRRLIPWILAVALVLPGCASVQNLTAAGRFDIAMETATSLMEECTVQANYVVQDRREGLIDQHEAQRRYAAFASTQAALRTAADLAQAAFDAGEDPDALTVNLNEAIGAARAVIRREGR